jgi:hypothetical protein
MLVCAGTVSWRYVVKVGKQINLKCMKVVISYKKFPDTLLPGWYWGMRTKNCSSSSGPYRTMLTALKDVCSELRFLVRMG